MTPVHNLHQGFSHVYVQFIFGPYYVFTILIIQIAAVGAD
jgi:hypothetical protein